MLVVKNNPNKDAYEIIAGDMVNRELSLNHYLDGEARKVLPPNYVGYPSYVSPTKTYNLKAVAGYIYIPDSIRKESFVDVITKLLSVMDEPERLDGRELNSMSCSVISPMNFCTDLIVDYRKRRDFTITDGSLYNSVNTGESARFLWHVRHISEIDVKIDEKHTEQSIAKLAGIFWDYDDILSIPHGVVTFEFGKNSFKAAPNMVKEKVTLFMNSSNPLMFELSKYWSESVMSPTASDFIRDINAKKVVAADISQVEVKPIRLSDDNDTTSTDVCFRCLEPLYGDIYGLCGYISKQDDPLVTPNGKIIINPICPLCLHTTSDESPLEQRYIRVLRLKWPKTLQEIIAAKNFSADKLDICTEALKGIVPYRTKIANGNEVQFYLIGDKYVGFKSKRDIRFTSLVNEPVLQGRKTCAVTVIS